jgi:hypothetical protein
MKLFAIQKVNSKILLRKIYLNSSFFIINSSLVFDGGKNNEITIT